MSVEQQHLSLGLKSPGAQDLKIQSKTEQSGAASLHFRIVCTYSIHQYDSALPVFILQCLWIQLKNGELLVS